MKIEVGKTYTNSLDEIWTITKIYGNTHGGFTKYVGSNGHDEVVFYGDGSCQKMEIGGYRMVLSSEHDLTEEIDLKFPSFVEPTILVVQNNSFFLISSLKELKEGSTYTIIKSSASIEDLNLANKIALLFR